MRAWAKGLWTVAAPAVAAGAILVFPGTPNRAADHLDPPGRTDPAVDSTPDVPADIADLFVWQGPETVRLALTFAGPASPSLPAFYDRDVLYKILISTSAPDDTAEIVIKTRFGPGAGPNEYGVRFEGVPGVNGTLDGPVETNLIKDGVSARAGLFDDPFFFDSRGLRETRSTGTIRLSNTRDFFAGQNVTGYVIEIPRSRIGSGNGTIRVWCTSSRFGGQL